MTEHVKNCPDSGDSLGERKLIRDFIVYRCFSTSEELLYVGFSTSIRRRMENHSSVSPWWCDVSRVTLDRFSTRKKALRAELKAIGKENPKYNLAGTKKRFTKAPKNIEELDTLKAENRLRTSLGARPQNAYCSDENIRKFEIMLLGKATWSGFTTDIRGV